VALRDTAGAYPEAASGRLSVVSSKETAPFTVNGI